MMDKSGSSGGPFDSAGQRIHIYNLVQIETVPEYLYQSFIQGNSLEAEIGKRIKSLQNAYGVVAPPEGAPDIDWQSRDRSYVYVCCKSIQVEEASDRRWVWTYSEYIPSACIKVVSANFFLYAVFTHGTAFFGSESAHRNYIAYVLSLSPGDLEAEQARAIRRFMRDATSEG